MHWRCDSCGKSGENDNPVPLQKCPVCEAPLGTSTESLSQRWLNLPLEELDELYSASKKLQIAAGILMTLLFIFGICIPFMGPFPEILWVWLLLAFWVAFAIIVKFGRGKISRWLMMVVSVLLAISAVTIPLQKIKEGPGAFSGALVACGLFIWLCCTIFFSARRKKLFGREHLSHQQLKYLFEQREGNAVVSAEELRSCTKWYRNLYSYTMIIFYLLVVIFLLSLVMGTRLNRETDFSRGNALLYGTNSTEKDIEIAFEHFMKGANSGDPRCKVMIAQAYFYGNPYSKDLQKGAEWALQAAEQEEPIAYHLLALYYGGEFDTAVFNSEKFYYWSKKEYEAKVPAGLTHLATCLASGIGCEKDQQGAEMLFEMAEKQGVEGNDIIWAMVLLGYQDNPQKQEQGIKLLQTAATRQIPLAYVHLALCYLGIYNENWSDPEKAFLWSHKAIDAGVVQGKTCMALCLLKGFGCPQNEKKGRRLLQEAAQQGDTLARQLLSQ